MTGTRATVTSAPPLLSVRGLCKYFPIHQKGAIRKVAGLVRAVDDVSFELRSGETLGLVGESGSGKTTVARCILRALMPTAGSVQFRLTSGETTDLATLEERRLKRLRPQMQMIFQDPFSSLNPRLTVAQIIGEPLDIHKVGTKREREERVVDILRKVGLKPEYRTRYPNAFSGGQRQRIGIARALIMRPSLVVADEAVSALDVSIQAQVINLLKDLQQEFKLTYIFVAHNLNVVRHFCDNVAVMYAGRIVEKAPAERLFAEPLHPYTQALLSSVPHMDPDKRTTFVLPGEIADPTSLPPGCAFHPRCRSCFNPCRELRPLLKVAPGSNTCVSCHLRDPGIGQIATDTETK